MKKIMITCWAMEIGGVERSLLGLLKAIDYSKYQVDLFLCRHEGDFLKLLPKEVNLLPEIKPYTLFQKPLGEVLRSRHMKIGLIRLKNKLKVKMKAWLEKRVEDSLIAYYCKDCLKFLPELSSERYDLAISFLTPHFFTRRKVNAKKYMAWIHTDYTAMKIDKKLEMKMWGAYDYIAGVSKQCVEAFLKVFPTYKDKVIEMENILFPEFIKEQANEIVTSEMPNEEGITKLCSVGRFSTAKAFDKAVKICALLKKKGCKIKWYVIGYGGDEELIHKLIEEYQVENIFIILGKKINPYPYMKACDLYVQPSRYEGKAVAVREAQILGKLPIITNFETAHSQVEDGVDGLIVTMEIEACANQLQAIIENKDLREALTKNIALKSYGNEEEVNKIYKIIDEEEKVEKLESRPIRVLHCVGKMNCGGAETMLMNIYRQMDPEKIRFDFLVHCQGEGYYDQEILERGGRIYEIPSQGTVGLIGYVRLLRKHLIEHGPFDVVHSHMDWQGGLIALSAKLAGVKRIIVHAHTSKLMNQHFLYKILYRIQKLWIAGFATDYWACSKEAEHFLFYKGLCKKSRRRIIPNAIWLEPYSKGKREEIRSMLNIEETTFVMGHVGSLSQVKNQLFLVDLAKALKDINFNFRMLLVGEGQAEYKAQIRTAISENQLDEQVMLLGQRGDIPDIMSALDLFVMPSLFEGLGIAAVEAQASGTPCIVSKNVPHEVDMGLELVKWLAISSIDQWVEEIKKRTITEKISEEKCKQALTKKGYSIIESARQNESLYLG